MPLNIRILWNAGTPCVSECVLKTLACRGLPVGPSKLRSEIAGIAIFAIWASCTARLRVLSGTQSTVARVRLQPVLLS